MKKRRHNLSRIREHHAYSAPEVCALLGVHKNTVTAWFRAGLKKMDGNRPYMIYGADLKAFLAARQQSRRKTCAMHEFYCFSCREPRRSFGNLIDIRQHSAKTVKLIGLCEICEGGMQKIQSTSRLTEIYHAFDIPTQQQGHLDACTPSCLNRDFCQETEYDPLQPQ